MTVGELLRLPIRAGAELRRRGLARTANNPSADHAETLAARTFGWTLNPLSNAGFDAWTMEVSPQRIEIKGRRIGTPNGSREVSALRRLDTHPFDRLLGILFDAEYDVLLGLDIPLPAVRARAGWSEHTRSAKFHLRGDLIREPGVVDVTSRLHECNRQLMASMA